ncbi:MAG: transporter substrate-binding domain-containing protein, partial [Pseudomonadota bacterium]|nr:transporter substrate-binding domain-containing protein [Pseudomonadota bacterium]
MTERTAMFPLATQGVALLLSLTATAFAVAPEHPTSLLLDTESATVRSVEDPIAAKKRAIRVLVSYSDTNYFVSDGRQQGLEYEMMQAFEDFLNRGKVPADKRRQVVFITVPFEELIPGLIEGRGDIAAGGLTVTPERKRMISFTAP